MCCSRFGDRVPCCLSVLEEALVLGCTLRDSLLDMVFEVLTEGLSLRSLVSLVVMEGAVVFCSGMSRVVWLCFFTQG